MSIFEFATTVEAEGSILEVFPMVRGLSGQVSEYPLGTVRVRTRDARYEYDDNYRSIMAEDSSYLSVDDIDNIRVDIILDPDGNVISHTYDEDFVNIWYPLDDRGTCRYVTGDLLEKVLLIVRTAVNTVRNEEFYDKFKKATVREKHFRAYKDLMSARFAYERATKELETSRHEGVELGISAELAEEERLIDEANSH